MCENEEFIDWDDDAKIKKPDKKSIDVELNYKGKGKPVIPKNFDVKQYVELTVEQEQFITGNKKSKNTNISNDEYLLIAKFMVNILKDEKLKSMPKYDKILIIKHLYDVINEKE